MRPHSHQILQKVAQTIVRQNMFCKGDRVLAGVSGGPDSVALLHILVQLASKWELTIGIAHLNHCLRGAESDKDAEFVSDLAASLNLPCYSEAIDIRNDPAFRKLSLEAAARQVRYDFFDRSSRRNGYHKLALGHHRDDNAELMLMFLFRGSGPLGFSGIPPVRDGRIVRPLISTDRDELVAFLNENAIRYQVDESNRDMRFLRNRVRHETIPYIQACCNPGIVETLNRFSKIVRSENDWMNDIIQPIYEKALVSKDAHRVVLAIPELTALPEAARRRVIRTAIVQVKGDLLRISFSHIEAAREMAEHQQYPAQLTLPDGIRVQRNKSLLTFYQEDESLRNRRQEIRRRPLSFFYSVSGSAERVTISETGAVLTFSEIPIGSCLMENLSEKIALLDMERLSFPLILRNIQPGDRFSPLGVTGTQKIQKYFIDHKIDRSKRQQCPVLLSANR
ncbi:MAG: tRNA lysidine(34) synthetase TilS, partial [Desulfatirhabdiaceae bacterium]|nr:tRNA lysidine(34) synthetase TilS [Desulfatirhabdiaceae bacterium]